MFCQQFTFCPSGAAFSSWPAPVPAMKVGGPAMTVGGPAMTMLQRLRAKMRTAGILSRRATLAQNDVWTAAAEKARSVPIFFRVN